MWGATSAVGWRFVPRRLFTFFSALSSLLLCVAVCALWVRSYWVADVVERDAFSRRSGQSRRAVLRLHSLRGALLFNSERKTEQFTGPFVIQDRQGIQRTVEGLPDDAWTKHAWRRYEPSAIVSPYEDHWWQRLGFNAHGLTRVDQRRSGVTRLWGVRAPHWTMAAATGFPPLAFWWHRRRCLRRFRTQHGLCPLCGYDLRATPTRCPECGRAPATGRAE
jgi:hypothetical protein